MYGRYLYSPGGYSGYQFDNERRYVFTWTPGSRFNVGTIGAWKIEDCSRSRRKRNAASLDTNIVFKENDDGFSSEMTFWYGNAPDASTGFDSNRDVTQRGRRLPLINKLGSTSGRILAVEEAATVNEKIIKANEKRPKVEGDDGVDITIVDDNNVEITTTDEKVNKAKEVYHALKNDEIGYNKGYATSVGSKPSSWMDGLFGWIKGSVGGLFGSSTTLPEKLGNSREQSLPDTSQHDKAIKISNAGSFLNSENVALVVCMKDVLDALDDTPSKHYQKLTSKGVEVIPNTGVAVQFALKKFDSFVENEIRNLGSKKKAIVRAELKRAYPEIKESLRRGVEFSGNAGLDDVLERCKECFRKNILLATRLCGQNFREAIQEPRQNLENP